MTNSQTDTGHPDRELLPEDQCSQLVHPSGAFNPGLTHHCYKPPKVFRNGNWWCSVHDPDKVQAREDAKTAKINARFAPRHRPAEIAVSQLCDCEPDKHTQDCPTYVKWVMDTQRRRGAGDEHLFEAAYFTGYQKGGDQIDELLVKNKAISSALAEAEKELDASEKWAKNMEVNNAHDAGYRDGKLNQISIIRNVLAKASPFIDAGEEK